MWFYALSVVFTFMSACLLLGLILLISCLIDKSWTPVDGNYGVIVGRRWEQIGHKLDMESSLVFEVECTVDGLYYRQDAKRSSKQFCITKKELAENYKKEVEIRYRRKKNGKIVLCIYEPAQTLRKAFIFSLIGIAGIVGQILIVILSIRYF